MLTTGEMTPIPGFTKYLISKNGEVFSTFKGGKILKTNISEWGYTQCNLTNISGKRINNCIHRLVALSFIPNPENKPQVNHIDCNKSNNNTSNLEWVTEKENMEHAYYNNLVPIKGEHYKAKLIINTLTGIFYTSVIEAWESQSEFNINYFRNMVNGNRKNKTHFIYA